MKDAGTAAAPTPAELSLRSRSRNLERMADETFDVAIIGGGITGAGIALDAVARGLSAALIERRDFASGTSSRSSKLIHGGLRYLEKLQLGLVREALHERAALRRIAPHLCEPLAFLVPIYRRSIPSPLGASKLKLRAGLILYDLLAGRENIGRHRWLPREQAFELAPGLEREGLRGCFLYYDCLTNDSRLVIEVIKAAAERGAVVANYAAARGIMKESGRVSGVELEDTLTGQRVSLRARVVMNATGVWSDQVAKLAGTEGGGRLRPSKGIHVVAPAEKISNRAAVLIPSLGERRFLFVIPWLGRTLIGTTDADYRDSLDEPTATPNEIDRVVASAARYFPGSRLSASDVISSFAGLRPLVAGDGGSTADLSRKEQILVNESGLISIIGGKLTTYRNIAERAVDLAQRRVGGENRRAEPGTRLDTRQIALAGGGASEAEMEQQSPRLVAEFGLPETTVHHLWRCYGGHYRALLGIVRESEAMKQVLVDGLPHIEAEVVYCARHEMAVTVDDFLSRRSRISLLAQNHGRSCAARVRELMAREPG